MKGGRRGAVGGRVEARTAGRRHEGAAKGGGGEGGGTRRQRQGGLQLQGNSSMDEQSTTPALPFAAGAPTERLRPSTNTAHEEPNASDWGALVKEDGAMAHDVTLDEDALSTKSADEGAHEELEVWDR